MRFSFHKEVWPLAKNFVITGFEYTEIEVVVVEVEHDGMYGRGEALGVDYLREDASTILAELEEFFRNPQRQLDRKSLLEPAAPRRCSQRDRLRVMGS